MDSGSLLKAIMGPVEVKILLSLGGWLSHGQSCHISYFYMTSDKIENDVTVLMEELSVDSKVKCSTTAATTVSPVDNLNSRQSCPQV